MVLLEPVDPAEALFQFIQKRGIVNVTEEMASKRIGFGYKHFRDLANQGRIIMWKVKGATFASLPTTGIFLRIEDVGLLGRLYAKRYYEKNRNSIVKKNKDFRRIPENKQKRNEYDREKRRTDPNYAEKQKRINRKNSVLYCKGCTIATGSMNRRRFVMDVLCQLCNNTQAEIEITEFQQTEQSS